MAMYTLDADHYVEFYAGARAGPHRVAMCRADGGCHIAPARSFYRFRSYPSGDDLSQLLREGRQLLEADQHTPAARGQYINSAEAIQAFASPPAGGALL